MGVTSNRTADPVFSGLSLQTKRWSDRTFNEEFYRLCIHQAITGEEARSTAGRLRLAAGGTRPDDQRLMRRTHKVLLLRAVPQVMGSGDKGKAIAHTCTLVLWNLLRYAQRFAICASTRNVHWPKLKDSMGNMLTIDPCASLSRN